MKAEFYPISAFAFTVSCAGCGARQDSKTTFGNSAIAALRAHAEKEFHRHLEQRGWNLEPLLCKKCCDDLVLKRVGKAFKDALEERGGDSK